MILMSSWEVVLMWVLLKVVENLNTRVCSNTPYPWISTFSIGLENGGRAGFIWIYLVSWIGFILINTCLAEMGSMSP